METTTARTARAIIDAANRIVRRDGVARLTLDAVAREAGLSKGGLLYHFPSKNALIAGMTATLLEDFEGEVRRRSGADDEETGRWLRAYVLATADDEPGTHDEADDEPGARDETAALIAAIATSPDLMAPLQRRYALWQQQVEADGLPPATATLVRLAADGLWLADLLGLAPPTGKLRAEVVMAMLGLTRGNQDGGDQDCEQDGGDQDRQEGKERAGP